MRWPCEHQRDEPAIHRPGDTGHTDLGDVSDESDAGDKGHTGDAGDVSNAADTDGTDDATNAKLQQVITEMTFDQMFDALGPSAL